MVREILCRAHPETMAIYDSDPSRQTIVLNNVALNVLRFGHESGPAYFNFMIPRCCWTAGLYVTLAWTSSPTTATGTVDWNMGFRSHVNLDTITDPGFQISQLSNKGFAGATIHITQFGPPAIAPFVSPAGNFTALSDYGNTWIVCRIWRSGYGTLTDYADLIAATIEYRSDAP